MVRKKRAPRLKVKRHFQQRSEVQKGAAKCTPPGGTRFWLGWALGGYSSAHTCFGFQFQPLLGVLSSSSSRMRVPIRLTGVYLYCCKNT